MIKINQDSSAQLSNNATSSVTELRFQLQKLRNEKDLLLKTLSERDETLANVFSYLHALSGR